MLCAKSNEKRKRGEKKKKEKDEKREGELIRL